MIEALLRRLVAPAPSDRALAAAVALFVIANLFYHGAQPYAVDAVPAPWDKLAHLLLFLLLGTLIDVAFAGRRLWAVLLVCALVAGTDELAQLLNPGREVDAFDWLADMGGAAVAAAMLAWLRRWPRLRAPR
jgi:VanZ family protein